MGQTQVSNGGIQPTILEPIQNLYTGSTIVFTVTVASKDSTHRYNGQGSSNGYKIDGKFAPFIVLTPGITYKFDQADNSNSGHPLRFYKDAAKVTAYTTNVTTNGTAGSSGAYTQIVTGDATPTILYYQCSAHGFMGNAVQTNGLSSVPDDGSITTAKIADNAITGAKMGTGSVGTTQIVNGAITGAKMGNGSVGTNQIVDQAVTLAKLPHGNGSTDGKFLRANNGADPSFESIPAGITINNQADNRIITATGTTDTLNGEVNATFTGTKLSLGPYDGGSDVNLMIRNTKTGGYGAYISGANGGNYILRLDDKDQNAMFRFNGDGNFGVGTGSPTAKVHVNTSHYVATSSGRSTTGIHLDGNWGNAGEYGGGISFACGQTGSAAIAARQGTSDGDVVGLSFFTHDSSTGSDNAVEKVRIHDGGAVSFNNGIILGNSLNYGTSNLLDDYEEGDYTVTLSGNNGNYSLHGGADRLRYIKIGKLVTLFGRIQITAHNNVNGTPRINLPFATPSANEQSGLGQFGVYWHKWNMPSDGMGTSSLEFGNSSSTAYFLYQRDNQSWSGLPDIRDNLGDLYVTIQGIYMAAS